MTETEELNFTFFVNVPMTPDHCKMCLIEISVLIKPSQPL